VKGDGGGIVTTVSFIKGAVLGGSCLELSQLQQLLERDEAGVEAVVLSVGPDVDVKEAEEAAEVIEAWEVGRLASKTNLGLGPADIGLMTTGDMVLRKSK